MSRVHDIFSGWRAEGRKGLIPFVTAGYPTLDATADAIAAIEAAIGPTIVELGIPFSDPIADGPVIAASMHEALISGTTPDRIFEMVRGLRDRTSHALVAMVSVSIVHGVGVEAFVTAAADAGIDGLIVPDLDVEGDDDGPETRLRVLADEAGLTLTLLVAPTTPPDRVASIVAGCTGWVYLLARVGITGERRELPDVALRVQAVRALTDLPVAVGFGISRTEHVASATAAADAAIVGTAIVRAMGEAADPGQAAGETVRELSGGLHRDIVA